MRSLTANVKRLADARILTERVGRAAVEGTHFQLEVQEAASSEDRPLLLLPPPRTDRSNIRAPSRDNARVLLDHVTTRETRY